MHGYAAEVGGATLLPTVTHYAYWRFLAHQVSGLDGFPSKCYKLVERSTYL
jgi:hypothetical protein